VTLPIAARDELAAFYPPGYGPHAELVGGPLVLLSNAIRRCQGLVDWRRPPLVALHGRTPGRGLDVGAGRGDSSAMLCAHRWQMTAVEPDAGAVRGMRERGIEARVGVLGTVPLEPGAYDFALFKHSLEHTTDPVADLRAAYSALRPGGLVLISVPNFGSWQRRAFAGAWYHLDVPRHRVHFTRASLERALRTAGFAPSSFACSSSAVGLPASIQYTFAGRCLFPSGIALRIASGLCVATLPLSWALDRALGEADTLHAVARRPA
jgi:SAM-dependent methyltransferase